MNHTVHNKLVSFIWSIADDCLRDVYVRGKYRDETSDYNQFKTRVDKTLKAQKLKLSASDKNAILNAVSWYDEKAEKIIKKTVKFKQDKLDELLNHLSAGRQAGLNCTVDNLPDYGYYPTSSTGGQKNESLPMNPAATCVTANRCRLMTRFTATSWLK